MKQRVILALTIFALLSAVSFTALSSTQASVNVNGVISQDTTWTKNAGPYNFDGPVAISTGVTLTIEPGTVVNFNSYYMLVNGTLNARGTEDDKITLNLGGASPAVIFTSYSSPWNEEANIGCIIENTLISESSTSSNTAISIAASPKINKCSLTSNNGYEYTIAITGGNPIISNSLLQKFVVDTSINNALIINNTFSGSTDPAINTYGNSMIIGNLITTNGSDGICLNFFQTTPSLVQNNTVIHNKRGIVFSMPSDAQLSAQAQMVQYNNLYNNDFNIAVSTGSTTINLPNNWWGTNDSQAISLTIYDSKLDSNLATVTYNPYLTAFNVQAPGEHVAEVDTPSGNPMLIVAVALAAAVAVALSVGLVLYRKRGRNAAATNSLKTQFTFFQPGDRSRTI